MNERESKILDEKVIGKLKQNLATFIKSNKIFSQSLGVLKLAELGYAAKTDEAYECFYQLDNCETTLTTLNLNLEKLLNEMANESDFKNFYVSIEEIEKQFSMVGAGLILYAEFREKEFKDLSMVTKHKIDPSFFSEKNCKNYLSQFVDFSKLLLDMYNTDLSSDIFCRIRDIAQEQEELAVETIDC